MATLSDNASEPGSDPCMQIQVDLSAMLDGELDAASVRRVMVHSDLCTACRAFLDGIRTQARLHREVHAATTGCADGPKAAALRRQLTENRTRLGRILYEMGKGFALMGLSPDFSREVGKEPVPVPDAAMQGKNLLDEVSRWARGAGQSDGEWVSAKDLFEQSPRTSHENLAKGQRLLTECLSLLPEHYEARIYLGLVHSVRGQRSLARSQFAAVLAGTTDPAMRGFALLNLGNVCLQEGDAQGAVELLEQLVASGVVGRQPRFGMAYFNLALALSLQRRFDESVQWFRRLHDELPHKRNAIARELTKRSQYVHLLRAYPEVEERLAGEFPVWFPLTSPKTT